jgi:hypothetical protein
LIQLIGAGTFPFPAPILGSLCFVVIPKHGPVAHDVADKRVRPAECFC